MLLLTSGAIPRLRSVFVGRSRVRRRPAWRFSPRLIPLEVRALLSTITVTNDDDSGSGSLRAAIGSAASGDTINFAPSAYGTITLTSGPLSAPNIDLTIRGPGANKLTISGDDTYTVFEFGVSPYDPSPIGANVTVSGLTIADGNAGNFGNGGGILAPVNLTLTNSVLKDNQAPGGSGGGISNGGNRSGLSLTIDNDLFEDDTAGSAKPLFFTGDGGAIDAENGSNVSVSSSTFTDNQSFSVNAQGGAINVINTAFLYSNVFGSLSVTGSTFRGNTAINNSQGSGFDSGTAAGGAIWTDPQVAVTISTSQFLNNEAEASLTQGGPVGLAAGGALAVAPGTPYGFPPPPPSPVTITNSLFSGNMAVGTGTAGSQAQGGAINIGGFGASGGGTATISGSTFTGNQALGDSSSINPSDEASGPASGGAIDTYLEALALTSDKFSGNQAVSGSGQGLQAALGGAIYSQLFFNSKPSPTLMTTIADSLFTGNQAVGGTGVPSYSTFVEGGALDLVDTPASMTKTSFIGNQALGSPGTSASPIPAYYGNEGIGGAVAATGASLSIQGGVIAGNVAMGGKGGDASYGAGETGGYGWGGGIFVGGQGALTLSGTAITANSAIGGDGGQGNTGGGGGYGQGGGIYVFYGGSAKLANVMILGNTAVGGAGGQGTSTPGFAGNAQGGGVFEYAATLKVNGGLIAGNSAIGGQGGGAGEGGGVFISGTGANASLTDVLVTLNSAIGGSGGGKGYGGGLYIAAGTITTLTKTKVVGNFATTSNDNIYGTYTTD